MTSSNIQIKSPNYKFNIRRRKLPDSLIVDNIAVPRLEIKRPSASRIIKKEPSKRYKANANKQNVSKQNFGSNINTIKRTEVRDIMKDQSYYNDDELSMEDIVRDDLDKRKRESLKIFNMENILKRKGLFNDINRYDRETSSRENMMKIRLLRDDSRNVTNSIENKSKSILSKKKDNKSNRTVTQSGNKVLLSGTVEVDNKKNSY